MTRCLWAVLPVAYLGEGSGPSNPIRIAYLARLPIPYQLRILVSATKITLCRGTRRRSIFTAGLVTALPHHRSASSSLCLPSFYLYYCHFTFIVSVYSILDSSCQFYATRYRTLELVLPWNHCLRLIKYLKFIQNRFFTDVEIDYAKDFYLNLLNRLKSSI
jgi:hypothetical protein